MGKKTTKVELKVGGGIGSCITVSDLAVIPFFRIMGPFKGACYLFESVSHLVLERAMEDSQRIC